MHSKGVSHAKAADELVFKIALHSMDGYEPPPPSASENYVSTCHSYPEVFETGFCELGFGDWCFSLRVVFFQLVAFFFFFSSPPFPG